MTIEVSSSVTKESLSGLFTVLGEVYGDAEALNPESDVLAHRSYEMLALGDSRVTEDPGEIAEVLRAHSKTFGPYADQMWIPVNEEYAADILHPPRTARVLARFVTYRWGQLNSGIIVPKDVADFSDMEYKNYFVKRDSRFAGFPLLFKNPEHRSGE